VQPDRLSPVAVLDRHGEFEVVRSRMLAALHVGGVPELSIDKIPDVPLLRIRERVDVDLARARQPGEAASARDTNSNDSPPSVGGLKP
jgi:hypothetical protein